MKWRREKSANVRIVVDGLGRYWGEEKVWYEDVYVWMQIPGSKTAHLPDTENAVRDYFLAKERRVVKEFVK